MTSVTSNNDNGISRIEINNVNDNVVAKRGKTENQVDAIADMIMRKLNVGKEYREYYCKVAWNLSESVINNNLEIALKSNRSPQRYFTWLCKRYMQ